MVCRLIRSRWAKNEAGFQQISLGTGLAELNPKYFCGFSHRLPPSFFPNVQMWGRALYWKDSPIFSCTLHCKQLRSVIFFFEFVTALFVSSVQIKVQSFKCSAYICNTLLHCTVARWRGPIKENIFFAIHICAVVSVNYICTNAVAQCNSNSNSSNTTSSYSNNSSSTEGAVKGNR